MENETDVNGPDTQPAYAWGCLVNLKFSKFIVGRDGLVLARFGQGVKPAELEEKVLTWLG